MEVATLFEGAQNNAEFGKLAATSDDPIAIGIDRECVNLIEAHYENPDRLIRPNFRVLLRTLSSEDEADWPRGRQSGGHRGSPRHIRHFTKSNLSIRKRVCRQT